MQTQGGTDETGDESPPTTLSASQRTQPAHSKQLVTSNEASTASLKASAHAIRGLTSPSWPFSQELPLGLHRQRQSDNPTNAEPPVANQTGPRLLGLTLPPSRRQQPTIQVATHQPNPVPAPTSPGPTSVQARLPKPQYTLGQPSSNKPSHAPSKAGLHPSHWQLGYNTVQRCSACRSVAISPLILVCSCSAEHALCASHLDLFKAGFPCRIKHEREDDPDNSDDIDGRYQGKTKKSRNDSDLDSPIRSNTQPFRAILVQRHSTAPNGPQANSDLAASFPRLPQSTPRRVRSPSAISYVTPESSSNVDVKDEHGTPSVRSLRLYRSFGVQTEESIAETSIYFDAKSFSTTDIGADSAVQSGPADTQSETSEQLSPVTAHKPLSLQVPNPGLPSPSSSDLLELGSFTSAQPGERSDSLEPADGASGEGGGSVVQEDGDSDISMGSG